eukprot:Em0001g1335a
MTQHLMYTEPPPVPEGAALRLYSCPICPYAERVRLILALKNVPYDEVNIHLSAQPDWFTTRVNRYHEVPVAEVNGKLIRESLIIFDYIDQVFGGGSSLWPTDPYLKAKARLILTDFGNNFIGAWYGMYRGSPDQETLDNFKRFLKELEDIIQENGNKFFQAGDTPGAVDFLIWPWFERIGALKLLNPEATTFLSESNYPILFGWISRMKEVEAVKRVALPDSAHFGFYKGYVGTGQHDYGVADISGKGITVYAKEK